MAYKMELIAYYNYLHPFHVFNVCIIIHIGQGKFGPRELPCKVWFQH